MYRAAVSEVALLCNMCGSGLLWDFWAYFDRIEVARLVSELRQLRCPEWGIALAIPVHLEPRAVVVFGILSPFGVIVRSIL